MIRLEAVSKSFAGIQAVNEVSLELAPGETLAILGPSGSGKSTLLRLIAGLEIPDAGTIYLRDTLASRPGWALAPRQRGLGFMFQTPALWPHLTVAQNIRFGLYGRQPAAARARLAEVMAQTRVSHLASRYPAQLSGGEARRVALARSLAPQPALLLLDEPLAHLDPELHREMLDLILATVSQDGLGLIYVTHNPEEAAQVAARRLWMRRGRLTAA